MIEMTTGGMGSYTPRPDLPTFVELETANRCNRTCGWCPTGSILDRSAQHLMPMPLFVKILDDLRRVGFAGQLALHNFNEPLANSRIVEEYSRAHEVLPVATLTLYTNGDYLTAALFGQLAAAGVRRMRITRSHRITDGIDAGPGSILRWARRALGVTVTADAVVQVNGIMFYFAHRGVEVELLLPDIAQGFSDRAGSVMSLGQPSYVRTRPCNATATSAAIDNSGQMKMCCNIVPGWPAHQDYLVGSLCTASFGDLWWSSQMVELRAHHRQADWTMSPICGNCRHRLLAQQFPAGDDVAPGMERTVQS
jgi:radical SAM protein with 4Fe4S-binding SPASM domain